MRRSPTVAIQSSTAPTWRPTVTIVAAMAAIALLVATGSTVGSRVPDAVGHGLSHLAPTLPIAVVLFAALRRWPPARPTRQGHFGRRLVVAGLTGMVTGQLLEIVGARVGEPGALAVEAVAHTAGQIVTILLMPVLLVGMLASLLAAAREGDVPWWVLVAVGVGAAGLFGLLLIGTPDGS